MIYNDDCMKIFNQIKSESIDCVVTDCPYHIVSGGCSNDAVRIGRYIEDNGSKYDVRKDDHGNYFLTDSKHVSLCGMFNDANPHTYTKQGKLFKHNEIKFEEWLPQVYRVLKERTHCYIMVNHRNLKELWEKAEAAGFIFQNLIVWDKGNSTPNKYYMNSYELILMLRKGKARKINNMGTQNILRVKNIMRNKKHPTEKPVDLMKILIGNSTEENEIVLDPFMGVGGVGVACKQMNRGFIGMEIDERYFDVAKERLNGEETRESRKNDQIKLFNYQEWKTEEDIKNA